MILVYNTQLTVSQQLNLVASVLKIALILQLFCLLLAPGSHAQPLLPDEPTTAPAPAPIRFLLTFDDGPSAKPDDNPTEKILRVLKENRFQPDIKAIFFVQTRAVNGGGTEQGRALLAREVAEGHLLGFHSATPRHLNHSTMEKDQFVASLKLGIADLSAISGKPPVLVRPPFWRFDADTLAQYQQHHLNMLLTDLSANDGVIYFINFSLTKRSNMRKMLLALRPQWQQKQLPEIDGAAPIVVTFHDVNDYTAAHMEEYLDILLDVARELEMPTTAKPFYDEVNALTQAAMIKTISSPHSSPRVPGIWAWRW